MLYKKIFAGILFILFFFGGVFAFLYFAFEEITMEKVVSFFSTDDFYGWRGDEDVKGGNGEGGDKDTIWSPGPLVKDKEDLTGFLTKQGIIEETNRQRRKFDGEDLLENGKLNQIAEIKLTDMFEEQYFAHISPSGEGVSNIAENTTYEYLLIGDNLALGTYRDDEDVVSAWMNSPGHRANILNDKYTEIGVAARKGEYRDKDVWMAVQVFAMPITACPMIDEKLKNEIDRKNERAERLLKEREALQREIDGIRPRGGEEHVEKVEEYNALGEEYNNLIAQLDTLIDKYNKQIEARDECIHQ